MRFLVLILLFFNIISYSKAQENDTIYWNSKTKLKWNDFNFNIPDSCSKYHAAAMTFSGIHVKSFWENKLPNYNIKVYFIKSESCAKDTSSLVKISHEQLHFDISELYARKMRKVIEKLRSENSSILFAYRDSLKILGRKKMLYQDIYDTETSHGIIDSIQVHWEKKVRDELELLKRYEIVQNELK